MTDAELRHHILSKVGDLTVQFVYCDYDVAAGAIKRGVVSVEDVVAEFRSGLYEAFEPNATTPLRG